MGLEDRELHILYKVSLSTPEESNKTREAGAEAKQYTVPFKAMQVVKDEKTFAEVVLRKSVVGETVYNGALETMYDPDFAGAPEI